MEKLDLLYQIMVIIVTYVMMKMDITGPNWIKLAIRGAALFMAFMAIMSLLNTLGDLGIIHFSFSASLENY